MKLSEKWRPKRLEEVAGHSRHLTKMRRFLDAPQAMCWLFEGDTGTGKTTLATVVAHELGCLDAFSGLRIIAASEFSVDVARELFEYSLLLRPMEGRGWKVLILEELEYLSPQTQRYLKVALERLPARCVVIATSNDTSKLDGALRDRFQTLEFHGDREFAVACAQRLFDVYKRERQGEITPPELADLIKACWRDGKFSMRRAVDALEWA